MLYSRMDWFRKPSRDVLSLKLGGVICVDLVREDPVSEKVRAKVAGLPYRLILIIRVRVAMAIIW